MNRNSMLSYARYLRCSRLWQKACFHLAHVTRHFEGYQVQLIWSGANSGQFLSYLCVEQDFVA